MILQGNFIRRLLLGVHNPRGDKAALTGTSAHIKVVHANVPLGLVWCRPTLWTESVSDKPRGWEYTVYAVSQQSEATCARYDIITSSLLRLH